eukprot:NODE_119_length_18186_cov_1.929397.p16 type:complete len:115 gc:universal NODE_119_length_18186_cov_1.929397:5256-5600(+)
MVLSCLARSSASSKLISFLAPNLPFLPMMTTGVALLTGSCVFLTGGSHCCSFSPTGIDFSENELKKSSLCFLATGLVASNSNTSGYSNLSLSTNSSKVLRHFNANGLEYLDCKS